MKSKKIICIVCSLLFCFGNIMAQERKELSKAHSKFEKHAFIDAREIYLDLAHNGHRPPDLLMKLGDSYYFNGALEDAFEWYAELITKFSEYDAEYLFRYAQTLKSMELYDEANNRMKEYYQKKGIDYTEAFNYKERDYLELIHLQSGKATVQNFDLNSIYKESSPTFMPDGSLLFSSARDTGAEEIDTRNNQPFTDLYSVKGKNFSKFSQPINTKFSEADAAFSKNGDTIYFTRVSNLNGKKMKKYNAATHAKLYRAVLKKGKWKDVKELPFNDKKYSVGYPAISPDGKKLFFASDMLGGYGKMDIYEVAILKNGRFGTPKNLGDKINTIGNEISPYIGANNYLYFASNGQLGLGGFDIFVSEQPHGDYVDPVNLGKPINSATDDYGFIIDDTKKEGYFVSNRPESIGDSDIFRFKLKENLITRCYQKLQIQVSDGITKNMLGGIDVFLLDENYNKISEAFTDANGFYEFEVLCGRSYVIRTKNTVYKTEEIAFKSNYTALKSNPIPIALHKGKDLSKTTISLGDDLNEVLQLSNIYFDKGKATLRASDKVELMKVISLLTTNPSLKIEIKAHTDSKGDEAYNHKLSLQRSKSVKKYLVAQGDIKPDRIKTIGLGERYPKINCGKECTEEEHQKNRRSEFVVVQ